MTELPKKILKKTNDESIVMIYGESGTGKSSLKLLFEGKDIPLLSAKENFKARFIDMKGMFDN